MEGGISCVHRGCGQTFESQKDLEFHLAKCGYKEINCPYCHDVLIQKALVQHLTSLCKCRFVPCRQCKEEIMFKDLSSHRDTCPEKSVTCDMCHNQLLLKQVPAHQETCPARQWKCEMKSFGCCFKGARHLMDEHVKDASDHFALLIGAVRSATDALGEVKTEVRHLKDQNKSLILNVEDLKKQTRYLGLKNEELEQRIEIINASNRASLDAESTTRAECVAKQQRINEEAELRCFSLETKVNSMKADEETLVLEPGEDIRILKQVKTAREMVDMVAFQAFGSLQEGREKIRTVYYNADLENEDPNIPLFNLEFPDKKVYKCRARHDLSLSLRRIFVYIVRDTDREPMWPGVERCLICYLDPTNGHVVHYMAVKGEVLTSDFTVNGCAINYRLAFIANYDENTLKKMKSLNINGKSKFAFILY